MLPELSPFPAKFCTFVDELYILGYQYTLSANAQFENARFFFYFPISKINKRFNLYKNYKSKNFL